MPQKVRLKPTESLSKTVHVNSIFKWLDKDEADTSINSDFDLIRLGKAGLTKASIEHLTAHMGISKETMAKEILSLPTNTLTRIPARKRLDKKTSSHVLEIARIMQHAYEVFEDEEKVKAWINDPNKSLDGKKPVELFDTLTGLNLVNDILTRIEEGVYS